MSRIRRNRTGIKRTNNPNGRIVLIGLMGLVGLMALTGLIALIGPAGLIGLIWPIALTGLMLIGLIGFNLLTTFSCVAYGTSL